MGVRLQIQERVAFGAREFSRGGNLLRTHGDSLLLSFRMIQNVCNQRVHISVGTGGSVLSDSSSSRGIRSKVLVSTVSQGQITGIALSQSIGQLFFDFVAGAMLVRVRELVVHGDLVVGAGGVVRPALFRSRRRCIVVLVE